MKIMIVDDHPMVRQGIKLTLDGMRDIEIVAEAGNGREAIERLLSLEVDVLILDINLPERNGFDVLQDIRRHRPALPVLILSIHPEGNLAIRALKAGASGFLNKESAPEALVAAVRKLAAGGTYVSPHLADLLVREVSGRALAEPHERLSDREYQVMCMLASGKSISQIAEIMHRSPNTISTYRARILVKMDMESNSELTQYAIANRLIA